MKRYVRAAEEFGFDPFDGHRYLISGEDSRGQLYSVVEDKPKLAIDAWFRIGRRCKINTSIMTQTRKNAIDLVNTATADLLEACESMYGCAYNLDYLINACEKQVLSKCANFHESELGDQVHPFDVG